MSVAAPKAERSLAASGTRDLQHVLVRVRSDDGQTILAHDAILRSKGSAMLGKMGKPIGDKYIDLLNRQIAEKKPTFLFLTTREGWDGPYVTFQCVLVQVHKSLPPGREELVPRYYFADRGKVTTWFEISDIGKMSKVAMNRIEVRSSGRPIMGVIKSSAVVFYVSYPGGMCSPLQRSDVKGSGGARRLDEAEANSEREDDLYDYSSGDDDLSGLGIDGVG